MLIIGTLKIKWKLLPAVHHLQEILNIKIWNTQTSQRLKTREENGCAVRHGWLLGGATSNELNFRSRKAKKCMTGAGFLILSLPRGKKWRLFRKIMRSWRIFNASYQLFCFVCDSFIHKLHYTVCTRPSSSSPCFAANQGHDVVSCWILQHL